jgi:hypothetical protein
MDIYLLLIIICCVIIILSSSLFRYFKCKSLSSENSGTVKNFGLCEINNLRDFKAQRKSSENDRLNMSRVVKKMKKTLSTSRINAFRSQRPDSSRKIKFPSSEIKFRKRTSTNKNNTSSSDSNLFILIRHL